MSRQKPVQCRILAVCLGNICRSPLAAAVLADRAPAGTLVRSAGLRDRWRGRPAHPPMVSTAAALGYDLARHRARQVTAALVAQADLVLAMDYAVRDELAARYPAALPRLRLYLPDREVPDPYGGDARSFAQCAALIADGAAHWMNA
ncbi:low molecular weight protein-tyrosine-phosphatase [Phaeacidiphilus oryzae]|uniref:low molecular weight protein-tyrosine-phosphatase n=1 Tax=Phaeacidiphilus oryzae TaxID=348818 RepID=UPI00056382E3|nr:low molecular weight protein-tyrosine-phosphatase [Phaeacidiphilus oryzae]